MEYGDRLWYTIKGTQQLTVKGIMWLLQPVFLASVGWHVEDNWNINYHCREMSKGDKEPVKSYSSQVLMQEAITCFKSFGCYHESLRCRYKFRECWISMVIDRQTKRWCTFLLQNKLFSSSSFWSPSFFLHPSTAT